MAKVKSYIICCFTLFLGICSSSGQSNVSPYEVLDSLLTNQIGIKEATGKNDGYWVEKFLKSVKRYKGDAWCAAFVSYDLQFLAARGFNVSYVVSGYSPDWAKKPDWKRGNTRIPFKMGDVFTIWFNNLNRPAHTGFIYKDEGNYVITVEGNTSDDNYGQKTREGNKVAKKRRLTKQLYTVKRFIK